MRPKKVTKSFYNPPTLVMKQALAALYFAYLVRWSKLPHWLLKGRKTLPTAAGAIGMGCIGFPIHPVWEVTTACNLHCRHCHASGGKPSAEELTTEEGKMLLDQIAAVKEFRMLVLTGGEPLVRKDIIELIEYASALGLEIAIATNGTLITPELARRLKKAGVCDVAIGLDAATPSLHDYIRGVDGCFDRTMQGIHATKEAGMLLQINVTVMRHNYHEIPQILDLAHQLDAEIVLLYNLIPQGRGAEENLEILPKEYAELMKSVAERQRNCYPIIEPTCAPQYWAYLTGQDGRTPRVGIASRFFKGCVAGRGLCYIKPNGDVWACPFIPVSTGNVRHIPLETIWRESELFQTLRDRKNLEGRCGECLYTEMCGGCRGRAYAHTGNYLAEDPFCFIQSNLRARPSEAYAFYQEKSLVPDISKVTPTENHPNPIIHEKGK